MLKQIITKTGKDNLRKRIFYSPTSQISINPDGFGDLICISSFKYQYEHSLPPHLFTTLSGEKYIVPTWQKVLPETQLNDIEWIKPKKVEKRIEKDVWSFKSSSGDGIYYVTKIGVKTLKCSCPGFYRALDRRCKHIKEIEKLIK